MFCNIYFGGIFTDKKKLINLIILIIAIIVFLVCGVMLVIHLLPEKENFDKYKNNSSTENSSSAEVAELPDNPIDFNALTAENGDAVGWLQVDGTAIDYPVFRSGLNTPEDFYLNHDRYKKSKLAGSIYVQQVNSGDFTDPNTVVYGHNMRNGSMFGTLKKFRNTSFFNENRYITVYTMGHILKYEIFSAFVFDDRHIVNSYDFYNTESYQSFLDICKNPISVSKNVLKDASVSTDDKIITLSTCTSAETERYLVVGVLRSDTKTK